MVDTKKIEDTELDPREIENVIRSMQPMGKEINKKSISLKKNTHDRLKKILKPGESFDKLLNRLFVAFIYLSKLEKENRILTEDEREQLEVAEKHIDSLEKGKIKIDNYENDKGDIPKK